MKALVTGAAGFIGSHLADGAARSRRGGRRASTASPTTIRGRSRKRTSAVNARPAGLSRSSKGRSRRPISPALLDGKTHVFHLAAQAGVRKSWGRDFRIYTDNNVDATQRLLEACVGRPLAPVRLRLELVGLRRQRQHPDAGGCPAAAGVAVRRHEAGRRAALLPVLREPRGADDVGAVLHGLRPAAAAGHGVSQVHAGGAPRRADHALRRRRADARLHVRDRRRRGDDRRRRPGRAGRAYNIGGGSRVSVNQLFEIIGRIHGQPLDDPARSRQKGDMRDTFADTTRARADLGFSPKVSLEQGLEAEYRWLANTPALVR